MNARSTVCKAGLRQRRMAADLGRACSGMAAVKATRPYRFQSTARLGIATRELGPNDGHDLPRDFVNGVERRVCGE